MVDEYSSPTTSLTIHGQDADNPSTFTTSSSNITSRITTTASISWNNIPTWDTVNVTKQSPSITTVVQELVDRSGWQSGNAMAFIITGSGKRVAYSYNGNSSYAPRLYIEYTTSGGPTPTPTNTPTGPTPTPTSTPTGSSCTVTLTPVADAYVRSGSYASTNYGSNTQLVVKAGGTDYKRETHLKFDLSSLGMSSITDADLELDVTYVKNGGPVPVTVYASGSDSWTEGGITWNNRPSLGTSQTTVSISSTGIASFDVTSLTSTEAAGDETLSLILWDNNSTDLEVEMRSKEDGTNAPELVVSGWCSSASAGGQQLASVDSGLQILWRNTISEFRDYMTVPQAPTSQEVSVIGPQPKPQSRSKVASQTTVTQSTVRKTYMLAGQAIAQKTVVTVGSNPSTPELYFIYTDHLGSANVLATADGNNTPVQETRFMPFGEYRTEPTADITDRGFTGHQENNYIKLVYMNSRWYDGYISRHISPDSIVPDPANPQSFNRYSYVENRPINFNDPTGHCKNGRGTGPSTCQVDGGADVSISVWSWFEDVAPKHGIQSYPMPGYELEMYVDIYVRGNVPDAYSTGLSGSASVNAIMVALEGNAGIEWVYDPDKQATTSFLVLGYGIRFGAEEGLVKGWWKTLSKGKPPINYSVTGYMSSIDNVEDVVNDFSGWFHNIGTTVATPYGGGTVAEGGDQSDLQLPRENRRLPYSRTYGASAGWALTRNESDAIYLPLATTLDWHPFPESYHFNEWPELVRGE